MQKTTVVNLNKSPYDVYIGRAGHGQSGYFGNPYNELSRTENVHLFREYFYKRLKTDREFSKRVDKLRGKRLGCFCAPLLCHGNVIAEYVNNLPEIIFIKLAVIGSSTFNEYDYLEQMLNWFDISHIISGSAKSVDSLVAKYAANKKIQLQEFLLEWNKYGKSAGYKRSELLIEASDELIAFYDKPSAEIKYSIDLALERSKPVHIFEPIYCIKGKPFWQDELANL